MGRLAETFKTSSAAIAVVGAAHLGISWSMETCPDSYGVVKCTREVAATSFHPLRQNLAFYGAGAESNIVGVLRLTETGVVAAAIAIAINRRIKGPGVWEQ